MENEIFTTQNGANLVLMDLFEIYKEGKTKMLLSQYEDEWANLQNHLIDNADMNANYLSFKDYSIEQRDTVFNFFTSYTTHLLSLVKYTKTQEDVIFKMMKFYTSFMKDWTYEQTELFYSLAIKYFTSKSGLKIRYSFDPKTGVKDNKDIVYYSNDDQVLYVKAASTFYNKEEMEENVTFTLYGILKHIETANGYKILKNEVSPRSLHYMNETIFINTFGKMAARKLINVPLMELDTRKRIHSNLSLLGKEFPVLENSINKMFKEKEYIDSLNATHYVPEAKNYADSFIATTSSKVIRGKPNSCPSNIKKYLFLNGQIKTIFQLDKQFNDAKVDYIQNPNELTKKVYLDYLAINDYLYRRNNILKIQTLFYKLKNKMNPDDLQQLFQTQKNTKDDYDLAIVLLRDRIHELNTYTASNSTNVGKYKNEIDQTKDLLAFAVSIPNKDLDNKILKYSLKANKFNLYDDKKMKYYQTLTGLGFGSAIAKIQNSLDNSSKYILHNLTEDEAKTIQKQLMGRNSTNQIEIVPPLEEKRPRK